MKLSISREAVEKLVASFRAVLKETGREATERERIMLKWFDETLGDSVDYIEELMRKTNKLRPEWEAMPHFSSSEMHALYGSQDSLRCLEDAKWRLMQRFLAYVPRPGEKLYQVRSRERFLSQPSDTLVASTEWEKTHVRKPPSAPKRHPDLPQDETRREYKPEEFREMFKGILPPDNQP